MSFFLTGGRRYSMRIDGFVSINAPLDTSDFITRPLKFSGSKLEVNYSTSAAGQVRVEIQDADGKAIPGFSLEDCEPIYGDHIARTVRWKADPDLAKLVGKPIKLRFEMSDADLYSLKLD